jgi:hypothetical protein
MQLSHGKEAQEKIMLSSTLFSPFTVFVVAMVPAVGWAWPGLLINNISKSNDPHFPPLAFTATRMS